MNGRNAGARSGYLSRPWGDDTNRVSEEYRPTKIAHPFALDEDSKVRKL